MPAYPASTQSLHDAFVHANRLARHLASRVQQIRNESLTLNIERTELLDMQYHLTAAITVWNAAKVMDGMEAYAQDQLGDPTLDVAAAFTSMVSAATNLRDWIYTNFPRDAGSGAVLEKTIDINGEETRLTFSPAQLTDFRTVADTFLATVG